MQSSEIEEPSCNIEDLINNNNDLILLTGSYKDFFGKLFLANKLKKFVELVNLLKKEFKDRIYFEIQRHNEHDEKIMKIMFLIFLKLHIYH